METCFSQNIRLEFKVHFEKIFLLDVCCKIWDPCKRVQKKADLKRLPCDLEDSGTPNRSTISREINYPLLQIAPPKSQPRKSWGGL